jgi:hypothetical protein
VVVNDAPALGAALENDGEDAAAAGVRRDRVILARRILFGIILALQMPGAALAGDAYPAEFANAVTRAEEIGARLHLHDWAAARATDMLVERKFMETDPRIRGWLTDEFEEGDDLGVIVTFVGEVDGRDMSLYRIRVSPRGEPAFEKLQPEIPLDDSQLARLRARSDAKRLLAERQDLCGEAYNTVVLPAVPATGDRILVYMLAATTQSDALVVGGHHLYEYSADGEKLISDRAFTRSCMEMPHGQNPNGKVEAMSLTHLLDGSPTEMHVFLNRTVGQPLFLLTTTNGLVWVIKDGRILSAESLDQKPAKKRKR